MPAGDMGVGQPGRTGEEDAPSGGQGGESQREGVDGTFHLCCAASAAPGMAHHLPNLRFSPLPPGGPLSALGWARGSEAAAGPGRMKTQKG